jgi:hypothetical protein
MKSGKKGTRCRLCSSSGADRMRLLDFEGDEQPLCLACVRPYDQGMKAGTASTQLQIDRLGIEVRRLGEQTSDYLDQLRRTHVQMDTLRAENKQLREQLSLWIKSDQPGEDVPATLDRGPTEAQTPLVSGGQGSDPGRVPTTTRARVTSARHERRGGTR